VSVERRHFTLDDRAVSVYQYVPFEVPRGASAFTVTMAYDRSLATVDLGLDGPDRFRGWSGGERSEVTVAPTWATPGYQPGELAGEWRVVLGLYRVGGAGVDVEVGVEVHVDPVAPPPAPIAPPRPQRPERRRLPAAAGREWLACDFHSHTVHSDGALEIVDLANLAASRGLDVLAVTDHNTVSHHPFLAAAGAHAGVVLVPGQEVTTDEGHANVFGDVGWIDFRQPAETWRREAAARGALMSVNHPWAGDCSWRQPLREPAPLVEMWHSTWDRADPEPFEDWPDHGSIGIGGSDFHRHGQGVVPGAPTTWVESEDRTVGAVLAAMGEGRVAISASPTSPVLVRVDGELVAVDADGCRLESPVGGLARLVDRSDARVAAVSC
jgi:hypothetical protein